MISSISSDSVKVSGETIVGHGIVSSMEEVRVRFFFSVKWWKALYRGEMGCFWRKFVGNWQKILFGVFKNINFLRDCWLL